MSAQTPSGAPSGTPATESLSTPQRRRSGQMATGAAIAVAVVLLIVGIGGGYALGYELTKKGSSSSTIQLTETGSSLLYPLFENQWDAAYHAVNPSVVLAADSTGSGTGQSSAEGGLVNIGASDAFVLSQPSIINLPVAISAQLVYYNIPGVTQHLRLNGTMLAEIYEGTITNWNNPLIVAAQTGKVQKELNATSGNPIVPLKRFDASGDTFLFTSLCQMSWSGWTYGYGTGNLSGAPWTSETGNSQMASAVQTTSYSIAYIGISYEGDTGSVPYAAVGDNMSLSASGGLNASNYILPSSQNISDDANLGLAHLDFASDQLAINLILGGDYKGATAVPKNEGGTNPTATYPSPYPIVNLEYTLVKLAPTGPVVTASALSATVSFLEWAISYGNYAPDDSTSSYLAAVNFVPLTPAVIGYDEEELAEVQP
ncbi:MAG TPA: substrate-binding domain-containing protein [Thermoplasmata archaeon]|nr:substrate-binding domain-containing protein [Thermoplasmata archaeon]